MGSLPQWELQDVYFSRRYEEQHCIFFFILFYFYFYGCFHSIWKFLGQGFKPKVQLWPIPQLLQHQILLTHCARPRMEPVLPHTGSVTHRTTARTPFLLLLDRCGKYIWITNIISLVISSWLYRKKVSPKSSLTYCYCSIFFFLPEPIFQTVITFT